MPTKYEEIKSDMEQLKSEVKTDIGRLEGKIDKLTNAVIGDKEFGQDGIVEMVRRHEEWITKQRHLWAKIYGGVAVAGFLWTYLFKVLNLL